MSLLLVASQVALVGKSLLANAEDIRDASSIPGSGKISGEGNGNPLQYSYLENFMDIGAWGATVHGGIRALQRWAGSEEVNQPEIAGRCAEILASDKCRRAMEDV